MSRSVVVLDYGSGNVRSAVRALERVGARVRLTGDRAEAVGCDGLFVPGVGAFSSCLRGLLAADGAGIVDARLAAGRPVLGVCVGMQVLFRGSTEPDVAGGVPGLGRWPGTVERLPGPVVPHMGWSTVTPGAGSRLFAGCADARFYFVHSYAVQTWAGDAGGAVGPADTGPQGGPAQADAPVLTWAEHGVPFLAAVEDGLLAATQFHPEKSGDAGATLLENWVRAL